MRIINWPLISMLVLPSLLRAQDDSPMRFQRWSTFDINNVRTTFNNTGMLCDGNNQNYRLARPPAFEFPNGSGISYGTAIGIVIGAPADQDPAAVGGTNPQRLPYLDGTMDEGPADFWNEEHFAPYPEFAASNRAAMSDDRESWPNPWPSRYPASNQPLIVGSEGWPGFGTNGELLADQESFAVAHGWGGTDLQAQTRWLKTQLMVRGLAWIGSLYEDFIVWVAAVRNISPVPMHDLRMGIHADLSFLPGFLVPNNTDADRHYYDPNLQLAYAWDDNGFEINPAGGALSADDIAWGGVIVLRMPGPTSRVAAYDASHFWEGQSTARGSGGAPEMYYKWNLLNEDDPEDSDKDGIDDDFDHNGVPDASEGGLGYYLGSGADGLQILGSGPFNLQPDETDTLIFATVFGKNKADLFTNAQRAKSLYESGWKIVTAPPAPIVEAVPGDRQVTLFWETRAEKDPEFEGYKIYRSADGGVTWGSRSFKDFDGGIHYLPLAQYDLPDKITGNYRTLADYAWFYLGEDQWVPQRTAVDTDTLQFLQRGDSVNVFVDRDVINGLRYRYYVAAYDSGNGIIGPLENTPATNPLLANNTVEVVPHVPVALKRLTEVRVVPNPYVVANAWEIGREREIQFIRLPQEATIRIYNSAGELVRTIEHRPNAVPSAARWNLLSHNGQLVAPGLYFYHVTSSLGESRGKFVVVY